MEISVDMEYYIQWLLSNFDLQQDVIPGILVQEELAIVFCDGLRRSEIPGD